MTPLARAIKALDRAAEDLKEIAVAHPHLKVIATLKVAEDALDEARAALRNAPLELSEGDQKMADEIVALGMRVGI